MNTDTYVYINIYDHPHIHTDILTSLHTDIYIYIHIYLNINTNVYAYVHIYKSKYIHIYNYINKYSNMHLNQCVCTYIINTLWKCIHTWDTPPSHIHMYSHQPSHIPWYESQQSSSWRDLAALSNKYYQEETPVSWEWYVEMHLLVYGLMASKSSQNKSRNSYRRVFVYL
jgi:hypothetical protein